LAPNREFFPRRKDHTKVTKVTKELSKGGPTLLPNEVSSLKSIAEFLRHSSELGDLRDLGCDSFLRPQPTCRKDHTKVTKVTKELSKGPTLLPNEVSSLKSIAEFLRHSSELCDLCVSLFHRPIAVS
jgi:hypothetical protein